MLIGRYIACETYGKQALNRSEYNNVTNISWRRDERRSTRSTVQGKTRQGKAR